MRLNGRQFRFQHSDHNNLSPTHRPVVRFSVKATTTTGYLDPLIPVLPSQEQKGASVETSAEKANRATRGGFLATIRRPISKTALQLFFGTFFLYAFFLGGTEDHIRAQMSLTRALAGTGSVVVDEYVNQTHDLAFFEGHYYIAKPPGFAFTVAPAWWLLDRIHQDLNFVWRTATWLFSSLPGAASSYSTLFLETPLLSLSLLLACYLLLRKHDLPRRAFVIGLLVGYAVLLHYIVALCVLPISVFLGTQTRNPKTLLRFFFGLAIPLTGVLLYNYWCFSDPFMFGHFTSAVPEFQQQHEEMLGGLMLPRPEAVQALLFSASKGLLVFFPFLFVALVGFIAQIKIPDRRPHAMLFLGMFLVTFVLVSSLPNWTGGMLSGPRYLLPVIPVLAIGLAGLNSIKSPRFRAVVFGALALSVVWSTGIWSMLTVLAPFSPEWLANPLLEKHLPDLLQGRLRPNLASVFLGMRGFFSLLPGVLVTTVLYVWAWESSKEIPFQNDCSDPHAVP
jgi:hypothetical protein